MMIPTEMAKSLKLPIIKTIDATTASSTEKVPIVIIPRVSIGDGHMHNVEAIVKDLPSESYIDGLLGLNFIKHFNVNIDFKHGKLTLEKYI